MKLNLTKYELDIGLQYFYRYFLQGYRDYVEEYLHLPDDLYLDEYLEEQLAHNSALKKLYLCYPVQTTIVRFVDRTFILFSKSTSDCMKILYFDTPFSYPAPIEEIYYIDGLPLNLMNDPKFILKLNDLTGIEDIVEVQDLSTYDLYFKETNHYYLSISAPFWGANLAHLHITSHLVPIKKESPLNPFTNFDYKETIQRVGDDSFEYEFSEAIKAYENNSYLGAASVGGIALENIVRVIIKRKTTVLLPEKTYLKDSIQILKKEAILPKRLLSRIESLQLIRNSNAHTNKDEVNQETVLFLFRAIDDLSKVLK